VLDAADADGAVDGDDAGIEDDAVDGDDAGIEDVEVDVAVVVDPQAATARALSRTDRQMIRVFISQFPL
jgi:hypothetical protein